MVREKIVSGDGDDDDEGMNNRFEKESVVPTEFDTVLRPKRIADMVGQRDVMEVLDIAIDAAKKRGEPLGHILLDGPPGLGKTTFATCIPREMALHSRWLAVLG